jgi:hypothetical protein
MQISVLKEDRRMDRLEIYLERQRRIVSVKKFVSTKKGSMFQSSIASESMGYSSDLSFSDVLKKEEGASARLTKFDVHSDVWWKLG